MAYTYVITTNIGKVRFLLQDNTNTTPRPCLMQDDEIQFTLDTEKNIYMAAAMCAEALAGRFRGLSTKSVGSLSLTYESEGKTWAAIAARLRTRGSLHMLPSAGGIDVSDRDDFWADTSLLRPSFYSDLFKDPTEVPPARATDVNQEYVP